MSYYVINSRRQGEGIDSEDDFFGNYIERLYKENKIEEIKKHRQGDVEILEKLFLKFCKDYVDNV